MGIFSAEAVMLELEARDKNDVLHQLASRIEKTGNLITGGIDNFMLSLIKREAEFSTAVGYDYAIPHGKSDAVKTPAVAFARLTQPILWDEAEDDWVKFVFMIAVPAANAGDEHMRILSRLASAIIEDTFRDLIEHAKDESEVIDIINTNI